MGEVKKGTHPVHPPIFLGIDARPEPQMKPEKTRKKELSRGEREKKKVNSTRLHL